MIILIIRENRGSVIPLGHVFMLLYERIIKKIPIQRYSFSFTFVIKCIHTDVIWEEQK